MSTSRLRAQIQLCRPVFHLKARGALISLGGRARIDTRKCDAIRVGPGAECVPREYESCPTLAAPAASRVTPPSRALLPARLARELLSRYALTRFYERHRLGPRGRHRSRRQSRMGERNAPSRISSPSLRRPYAWARRSAESYAPAERRRLGSVRAITSTR